MALPLKPCFNWETSLQTMNDPAEMSSYCSFFQEETPPPLPDFSDHESFFFLNNDNQNSLLFDYYYSFPELTSPLEYQTPSFLQISDYNINVFPSDDDQTFQYPYPNNKRQKLCFEDNNYHLPYHYNDIDYYFYDGFDQQSSNHYPYCSSLMLELNDGVPPLQLPAPASDYGEKIWGGGEVKTERKVSAQSMAARERRKKIAEKTQELGKMVPGGCKMNTAEMLLAASKYVKYLQSQVSMLQLMNTLMEDKPSTLSDNLYQQLQAILGSPGVEEKLYLQEKCLVPQHLVTTLTNHTDIQARPSILKDLNQLINVTDIQKKQLQ
ncbi:transcription factor bHLH52-like [Prosopis cineraria]|uniref:transcription factor bHLH52-like n=1 Tax=Prosopis cineraria TaxID=364024 RepID=UPI00240F699E|nr:transcription factor bHLH52-like [Prosopis cineraria]